MARQPRKLPSGEGWDGERVKYHPKHKPDPEFGTVIRMADAKELALFVMFDGDTTAKLCYARDLERI